MRKAVLSGASVGRTSTKQRGKIMRVFTWSALALATSFILSPIAQAEILAMLNYESKPAESLKALKISAPPKREEGIAIIDVDPKSPNFNTILMKIPLPADLVAHHIFYDRTMTKAYITALGKGDLYVINMKEFPYRLKKLSVPNCKMGEDIILSPDNKKWYLTCMASDMVYVGDVATDSILSTFKTKAPYPHGLAVHSGIDRILVSNTISGELKNPGELLSVHKASTNEALGTVKVSAKASPSGVAPVEVLFKPDSNPPIAFVTNMFGHSLWTATWNAKTKDFDTAMAFDFKEAAAGVPLEIYFNPAGDRMYVTTSSPGKLHIFDVSKDPAKPKLMKTIDTAEGAHHVAFTKDWKYAFVQNSFINLPKMRDGSISVVDLEKLEVVATADVLKNEGFNPNCIVLLPKWNHLAGH
jgi:DNA-binding beta-propeller fold protein YncE